MLEENVSGKTEYVKDAPVDAAPIDQVRDWRADSETPVATEFPLPVETLLRRKASLRQEAIGRLLPIPTLLPPGKVGQATLPSSEPSTSYFLLWSARCWPSPL